MFWNKKKREVRWLEKSYISKALELNDKHNNDTLKIHLEKRRLQLENKLPNCYNTQKPNNFSMRTCNGIKAYAYLDIVMKYKENPNMTLKEYFDGVNN